MSFESSGGNLLSSVFCLVGPTTPPGGKTVITGVRESLPLCQPTLLLTPQQPTFLPQAALLSATPASHQLHTSHSEVEIQFVIQ